MPPLPLITAQTEGKAARLPDGTWAHRSRTQQVLDWVWRKRVTTFDAMSNLPPRSKNLLAENYRFHTPGNRGNPRLCGHHTEVLTQNGRQQPGRIRHPCRSSENGKIGRVTLCVSSQVGCAFGCHSALPGCWALNATSPREIIGQILSAEAIAGKRVNNIVFMGMGTPFQF